jgi:uncharacterized protein (TIGR02265 family)
MTSATQRVLDQVGAHCDLEHRLKDVPPSARLRGIWLRAMHDALAHYGKLGEFEGWFPRGRATALQWYPVSDFLCELAVAGTLVASPARIHDGMLEIGKWNARSFTDSLLGRTLIRLLSPDPTRVIQQGAAARRQSYTYGRWEVNLLAPRHAQMFMRSEYIWIESYFRGAARGTYEAIGVQTDVTATLDDPYNGVIDITW